jgi:hypothetical protein
MSRSSGRPDGCLAAPPSLAAITVMILQKSKYKSVIGLAFVVTILAIFAVIGFLSLRDYPPNRASRSDVVAIARDPEVTTSQVAAFCGACHVTPPPGSFPRDAWQAEVARGYRFFEASGLRLEAPVRRALVRYYEDRAPSELPLLGKPIDPNPHWLALKSRGYGHPGQLASPAVANARFVHLSDSRKLDVLICDMKRGEVLSLKPYDSSASLRVLCDVLDNPGHAEVVDLDGDGRKDILVADLGSFIPSDEKCGSVVWLRGGADGTFTPLSLASGLGRVADAQAADFDGDGDLDLVVAVFGMQASGEVLYLENRTSDYARPVFVPKSLDPRHGTIHVPVADLNGDGRPDFVALISQEHETVVAFLNDGGGRFGQKVVYSAPHPAYGSSGIELVDLDLDGDLDVLYTNGDVLDKAMLRPDHGIEWLENRGSFPFLEHHLTPLYGASCARAADIDHDGDLDIVATSFLPGDFFRPLRSRMELDSVILLEQTEPGRFVRHSLETVTNDHATCDLGDFDEDGEVDLLLGNFVATIFTSTKDATGAEGPDDWLVVAKNLGRKPVAPASKAAEKRKQPG